LQVSQSKRFLIITCTIMHLSVFEPFTARYRTISPQCCRRCAGLGWSKAKVGQRLPKQLLNDAVNRCSERARD
jgi:hypothetical protein